MIQNKLIDGIFHELYYEYVPYGLKAEWRNMYHNYATNYYAKMRENTISPQTKIDLFNEENEKLEILKTKALNFKANIINIVPLYDSDMDYSNDCKVSLYNSINEILEFIENKQIILIPEIECKNYPIRNSIEHFNYKENKNDNKYIFILIIIIILFLIYVLLR